MTLPILRHESRDHALRVDSRSRHASSQASCGNFRPGLCIIVIQPDGCEERCIACWGEAEECLRPGDYESPILLPPSRPRADWEI